MLPRVLHLLSFENEMGVVGTQMDAHRDQLPLWVWFTWIPQLLTSLQRAEAQHVKPILSALGEWMRRGGRGREKGGARGKRSARGQQGGGGVGSHMCSPSCQRWVSVLGA